MRLHGVYPHVMQVISPSETILLLLFIVTAESSEEIDGDAKLSSSSFSVFLRVFIFSARFCSSFEFSKVIFVDSYAGRERVSHVRCEWVTSPVAIWRR